MKLWQEIKWTYRKTNQIPYCIFTVLAFFDILYTGIWSLAVADFKLGIILKSGKNAETIMKENIICKKSSKQKK